MYVYNVYVHLCNVCLCTCTCASVCIMYMCICHRHEIFLSEDHLNGILYIDYKPLFCQKAKLYNFQVFLLLL